MGLPKLSSPLMKQLWVASGIYFAMISNGMLVGIANCMLPALQAPNSTIPLDLDSGSWLTASVGIANLISYFCASALMASCGRRLATIVGLVPAIVGPIICYLAKDLKVLTFGRFLSGFGVGIIGLVGVVVVGEYTSPKYRGILLNLKSCMHIVGVTSVHILGNYLHWRTVTLIMMVPYVLNLVMACSWPESPSWLATQKRYDETIDAFFWLRGKSEQATVELNALIETQKQLTSPRNQSFTRKITSIFSKFKQKNFIKPLGIYLFAAMLLETSGRHIFPAYAMQIIQQIDSNKSNEFMYTISLDLIMGISGFASVVLVKLMKRRTLLLSSGAASAAILLTVSLYYYLKSKLLISESWNTLSLVLFGSYFVFVNLGCTPITFTISGEIFPLEHRSLGSAMAAVLIATFMFITLKITPGLLATIKIYGTFTVYGVSMAVCLLVIYFTLPETKDKTLQEIEDYFNPKPIDVNKESTITHRTEEVHSKLLK